MSQNRLGGNGPATLGNDQPSTAFDSQNDKTTSAGAYTKVNNSYRPISAYPMSSGIKRSQEKKGLEGEFMSQSVKGGVKLIHHSQMNYPPFDSANTRVSGGGYIEESGRREDIVFDDKYIISENTMM